MKVTGKLHAKFDTQQVTNSFKKREFVLEYTDNPLYPQFVKFESTQDRVDLIEPYNTGDTIEVEFNLKGREWTNPQGKKVYFNTLDAWRISKPAGEEPAAEGSGSPVYSLDDAPDEQDDLPF